MGYFDSPSVSAPTVLGEQEEQLDMGGNPIVNAADADDPQDVVTKKQLDEAKPVIRTQRISSVYENLARFYSGSTGSGTIAVADGGLYLQTVGSAVGFTHAYAPINLSNIWEKFPRISWLIGNRQNYGNNASYSLTLGLRKNYAADTSHLGRTYVGFAGTAGSIHGIAANGDGSAEQVTANFDVGFTTAAELICEVVDLTTVKFIAGGQVKTITGLSLPTNGYANAISHTTLENPGGQGYYNYGVQSFDLSWFE